LQSRRFPGDQVGGRGSIFTETGGIGSERRERRERKIEGKFGKKGKKGGERQAVWEKGISKVDELEKHWK
jgi:hypothetical protein